MFGRIPIEIFKSNNIEKMQSVMAKKYFHGNFDVVYVMLYTQLFSIQRSLSDLKKASKWFQTGFLFGCTVSSKKHTSTVSNKNIHLPVFEICVFRGYLRNHLNPVTNSADICKNAVLAEKSKLLEKIRRFEKFKNFFSWI